MVAVRRVDISYRDNGNMNLLTCFTKGKIGQSVAAILSSPSWLKVIAGCMRDYCERENMLLEKQCGCRPQRSTVDMMLVVRRFQKLLRTTYSSLNLCLIDLTNSYSDVNRNLLWDVHAHFGVPPRMLTVIRHFHDGMQACVPLDDGQCSSDKLDVGQGLRQGCVLTPLLFNMFTAAPSVCEKCFLADSPSRTTWCSTDDRNRGRVGEGHFTHRQSRRAGGGKKEEEVQRL